MNEFGERIATDAVRFRRTLPGPIERVWEFLTNADKRSLWLCGGITEQKAGGRVEMRFNNQTLSAGEDDPPPEKYKDMTGLVVFEGEVTACEPPTLLRHTWTFDGEDSEVTYELSEQGDQVELVLTHRHLATYEDVLGVSGGWHTHLDILVDLLNQRQPKPFWRTHTALEAVYEERLAQDG